MIPPKFIARIDFSTRWTQEMHYISTLDTLWNQTFRNFVYLDTCSECADAAFSFLGQSGPQFFKHSGHKYVKLLNIYLFFYLIMWLVCSMTPHPSTTWALSYKCFVKSNWCRPALVIFTTKIGLFRQSRSQVPFRRYAENPLHGSTFLYARRKKCTISPLWNTLESNVSKFCTPEYLFWMCRCSI